MKLIIALILIVLDWVLNVIGVLPDHWATVVAVVIMIYAAANELFGRNTFDLDGPREKGYIKPYARKVDSYTVGVHGSVDTLQKMIYQVTKVDTWEHIGENEWLIHLQGAYADYVTEAINKAQDGTV